MHFLRIAKMDQKVWFIYWSKILDSGQAYLNVKILEYSRWEIKKTIYFLWNVEHEDSFPWRHCASPLTKSFSFASHGWKFKYLKVSVSSWYVWMSRVDSLLKFSLLYTFMSKHINSESGFSNEYRLMRVPEFHFILLRIWKIKNENFILAENWKWL